MAWRGTDGGARFGAAGWGLAGPGEDGYVEAVVAGQCGVWPVRAGRGRARFGRAVGAWPGAARLGLVGRGEARQVRRTL
jgi:hypothetical protein